ncbi:MAG: PAS domain S-box protein [Calditrichaeota bacterium]|nr:PAS domain S-box protein [Calditrichota bacterium]
MNDQHKTKAQLIEELEQTRKRVAELEQAEIKRKQAEDALEESEQRYRQIIEEANDTVYTTAPDGYFLYVNPPIQKLTGYSRDELIGMHFAELIPQEWRNRVQQFYVQQFKDRVRDTTLEFPILTRTGEEKWIEQKVTLLTEDDHVTGFQSIVRDITDRKEAEEKLRGSEERFRLMFENTGTDNTVISVDGVFLVMNEMGAGRLGGKPEDFVGKSIHNFFSKEACDEYLRRFYDVIESGEGKVYEDCVELPTGNRWFLTNIQPVIEPDDGLMCVQLISQDITERKRAEETLKDSEERFL